MPVYGFRCENCGCSKEMKLTYSEYDIIKNNIICDCGTPMKRDIELPSFILNGDGWHRDGYNRINTKSQLDKELKKYDEIRSKNERGIFEREV